MNILVTGANGQLGNEIRVASKGENDKYFFTDITEDAVTTKLDITNFVEIQNFVKDNNIDIIINCAAFTNADAAEDNQRLCNELNCYGPMNLAMAAKDNDTLLVHISTDYVFGKRQYNEPCKENQECEPVSVYGRTKLAGEQKIIESGCKYVIIRTAWLYSEFGKNFCKTMLNLTSTKDEIKVVFDQAGTPTYALDLAEAIITIIKNPVVGVYHYSNEGVCSWFDFATMVGKIAGNKCKVLPCHSDEYPSKVIRPSYSILDKTKIKETFGLNIPYWVDSLEKCINKI